MKKSLIALAALAAMTAASAQSTVAISGTYNLGFQKVDSGATSFDLYDANITFAGVEDLGGGLKASFSVNTQFGGRQNLNKTSATSTVPTTTKDSGIWGRNVVLSLAGGFGTVSGGRIEGTNTIESAIVSNQSLSNGFDQNSLTGSKSNYTTVGYTTPAFNGFTVTVSNLKLLQTTFAPATTTATTDATTGITTLTAAAASTETSVNVVGASYSNGPLVAGLAYKMVDLANTTKGNKTEMFATYDLGVAKLGLGYAKNSGTAYEGQKAGMLISGAVPMGALTIGADYYTRGAGGATTAAGVLLGGSAIDGKAYALVAKYDLSKRTNLRATVGKLTGTSLANEQQYRVGMYHAF